MRQDASVECYTEDPESITGLAIGFVVVSGAISVGGVSGGGALPRRPTVGAEGEEAAIAEYEL